jgi:formate--tetrahydrofolate ligase
MHGGVAKDDLKTENVAAVEKGCSNLQRHVENVKKFGVPPIVAINRFDTDTAAEINAVIEAARSLGTSAVLCTHWSDGGKGAEALAHHVVELSETGFAHFKPLYPDEISLWDKVNTIATQLYGARELSADASVRKQFQDLQAAGYGHFPICMAKTQYSFSTDPSLKGAPSGHVVPIREVRLSAGAEFLVVITGEIMTMPGLPKVPSANHIHLNSQGQVDGLF